MLAINNLYCERDPANSLDLRDFARRYIDVTSPSPNSLTATTSNTSTTSNASNFIGPAEEEITWLDFIKRHPWFILFIIILFLFLAYLFWYFRKQSEADKADNEPDPNETAQWPPTDKPDKDDGG